MHPILKTACQTAFGLLTILVLSLNTIIIFIPVFVIGMFKLIPYGPSQRFCTHLLTFLCSLWIDINTLFIKHTCNIQWHIKSDLEYNFHKWYLVISNHQSWLDIVVMQKMLHKKVPELKFFVKDQLKWVPFLGFTWWIFDHPFMKRYSKEYLEKHPEKKGLDLAATKRSCEKFKDMPVAIMNFVEGTRFTNAKHIKQKAPYQHLLNPKAGGIAFVLNCLGDKIHSIIDVTITYPDPQSSIWDYVCGRIKHIGIYAREIKIPEAFLSMNYFDDPEMKQKFQLWLNEKWAEKDAICQQTLEQFSLKLEKS